MLLASSLAGPVAGHPHPTDGNRTLWSGDVDALDDSAAANTTTPIMTLARATDLTFDSPPAGAEAQTHAQFARLDPGGRRRSVAPQHADREQTRFIEDAHATVFAVRPSTRLHRAPGDQPLLIASNGTVDVLVDYRLDIPDDDDSGVYRTDWTVMGTAVEAVRLTTGNRTLARATETQTPSLAYDLRESRPTTLTVAATIEVRLRKQSQVRRNNTTVRSDTDYLTKTLRVRDSVPVEVAELTPRITGLDLPDGGHGLAIDTTTPWRSIRLPGGLTLRSPYRFYSARDRRWDTLSVTDDTERRHIESPGHPLQVHAVPARRVGTLSGDDSGQLVLWRTGHQRDSPTGSTASNVTIDVVSERYTDSRSVAVRMASSPQRSESIRVSGLVRGTQQRAQPTDHRTLSAPRLTATVVASNATQATVEIDLTDPLQPTRGPSAAEPAVRIDGRRISLNAAGTATITVTQPGSYTVRYNPKRHGTPAREFTTRATVTWSPRGTVSYWVDLLIALVPVLVTAALVCYALRPFRTGIGGSRHRRRDGGRR
jgi:hypothetical protein